MPPLHCTAIVPTLNRPADLEVCLKALAAARPAYAAVIVVDQGETPALGPLVLSHGASYLHVEQRGISKARNTALRMAATPWIHFPDDDAIVKSDLLGRVADALARSPSAGFLAARVLAPDGRPIMVGMEERARPLVSPRDVLATVMSPGLFVAARVMERCGVFDERFGLGARWPSGEESDLLFRALAAGEAGIYVPDAVVVHPDPQALRDTVSKLRRARLYGRGWGALFARHAATAGGAGFASLHRYYVLRALGGAFVSALTLRPDQSRYHWESWRGRREGWRGFREAGRGST